MEETDPRYSRRLRSRLSAENVLTSSTLQVDTFIRSSSTDSPLVNKKKRLQVLSSASLLIAVDQRGGEEEE